MGVERATISIFPGASRCFHALRNFHALRATVNGVDAIPFDSCSLREQKIKNQATTTIVRADSLYEAAPA
jgi:hypothetical protein